MNACVQAEVHAQMSQEVLNQIQAAAQQGLEAAAAGRAAAAPGATIAELNARFAAIGVRLLLHHLIDVCCAVCGCFPAMYIKRAGHISAGVLCDML